MVDLQVFACPRITLKPLVPSFPCFAKILVSLMEKVRGTDQCLLWLMSFSIQNILLYHQGFRRSASYVCIHTCTYIYISIYAAFWTTVKFAFDLY